MSDSRKEFHLPILWNTLAQSAEERTGAPEKGEFRGKLDSGCAGSTRYCCAVKYHHIQAVFSLAPAHPHFFLLSLSPCDLPAP